MAVVTALIGVAVGGLVGLFGGLVLQARADKRRMIGAARLIAAELRHNAGEVEHYFLAQQLEREGSTSVLSMPVRVGAQAWNANARDLMHLADADLRDTLLRLYVYLDRFEREPALLRPNMHERMREAAARLDALSEPTWWDSRVLRISGAARRDIDGTT